MKLHFISGLPRSGSTLLSAILRQNPRFTAGMTSPVSNLFRAIEDSTARKVETSVFVTDEQREALLRGVFSIYYALDCNKVIFDTSRMWCARLPLLCSLFPNAKYICCVREIGWVMDSFERIYRRNNYKPSAIFGYNTTGTVYSRILGIANSDGIVGYALDALREAWHSDYAKNIMLIDYEALCKNPEKTIKNLYEFIGEDEFQHNFEQVEYSAGEFDSQLGAEGLHEVSGTVEWKPRKTILPPDLFSRFNNDNFWRVIKNASNKNRTSI